MERGRRKNQKYDKSVFRAFALVTQFGINMLVPIGMMSALGVWLDSHYGTSYWTVLLFFAGAAAGGRNIFRMAKKVYDTDGEAQSPVHEDDRETEKQK